MDITTPNLDPSAVAPNKGVKVNSGQELNATHVQFSQMIYDTREKPRKPSFLSRFLTSLGGFAPLAYIAAPFTGGLSLIAGAAMQGAGNIGATAQANHMNQEAQRLAQSAPPMVAFPGAAPTGASDPTLTMISGTRNGAATAAIYNMK